MRLDHEVTSLTLRTPLRISRASMSAREAVRVTLSDPEGGGHGEVVTSPRFGLTVPTITDALERVREWMGEDDAARLRARLPRLRALLPGALPVVAAVDAAVHDRLAVAAGEPLWRHLDCPPWDRTVTAYTLGITDRAEAAALARRCVASGCTVLKVKTGAPDPADDIARVLAVRAAAPEATVLLDPNGAWDVATAIEVLAAMAPAAPAAVEQPVPAGDPDALGAVATAVTVPVIADEDAATVEDLTRLPAKIAGINVKLAECGGIDAALAMIGWARRAGLDVMLGCQVASSLGIAPAAHLSGWARWVDLDGHLLLSDDPWSGLGGADGLLRCPDRPGLGVVPVTGG